MKTVALLVGAAIGCACQAPGQSVDWHFERSGGVPVKLVWQSVAGRSYDLWSSPDLAGWTPVAGFPKPGTGGPMEHPIAPGTREFFRLTSEPSSAGVFVPVAAGSFQMGDALDGLPTAPQHAVNVSGFQIQTTEVTNEQLATVLNWAYGQGRLVVDTATVANAAGNPQELLDLDDLDCRILWNPALNRFETKAAKGVGFPCVEVTWFGAAAYCNYRSELDGLTPCYSFTDWSCNFAASGYRLPTEAEWEKAARAGLNGKRFPWGDTISHDQANYYSSGSPAYDVNPEPGYHPDWDDGGNPLSSPVGTFPPNDYGLHDMAGNVWEWCGDWYGIDYYLSSPASDPTGPPTGSDRLLRGGGWSNDASTCRVAFRGNGGPGTSSFSSGFRTVHR